MSGYSDFALFYDELQEYVDYESIARFYNRMIEKFGGKKGLTLDLACGTGKMTRLFQDFGYDMIAVDASEEMLDAAARQSDGNIRYICQDMTELDMYGTLDNVICVLDGINHLENIDEVTKVFGKVSLFLNPGGLFVFDVNTIYNHQNLLGNNTFIIEKKELYTVWQNIACDSGRVDIELDFFRRIGDIYRRYTDSFSETAYELDLIEKELKKAGFEVAACCDWLCEKEPGPKSEKAVFTAVKV